MRDLVIERCATLPDGFSELVQSGSDEGFTFMPRLERAWQSGENRFDRAGESLLCARVDSKLVGVCGLNVDPFAGDPGVGRVRHLYVSPEFRRRGVGTRLASEIVALAKENFAFLRLRTQQAASFYERLGFERCEDPDATHVMKLDSWSP